MQNVPSWVSVIGTLFVVVSVIAGAVAVATSKATTSRQALLESNNKTLAERVDLLEDELERERRDHKIEMEKKDIAHQAEVREYQTQIKALRDKVNVLEKVVTGKEQLDRLTELLIAHDGRVDGFFRELQEHDKGQNQKGEDLKNLMIANKRLLRTIVDGLGLEEKT